MKKKGGKRTMPYKKEKSKGTCRKKVEIAIHF